eukprot:GHRR01024682.1.p1 GENE.GHRR01024682.1~~GHRR01024682.1.p1  ORF type:complete len:109 (+),score=36.39 GHRR01024682.1:916-1242(+)
MELAAYMHCWQILQECHAPLTQLLGKTSGKDTDKLAQLQSMGIRISEAYGLPILAGEPHRLFVGQCLVCSQPVPGPPAVRLTSEALLQHAAARERPFVQRLWVLQQAR